MDSLELINIDRIKIGKRYREDLGDLSGLMLSIAQEGLLHPILVRPDDELIAGLRRIEAHRRLGRSKILSRVLDVNDVVAAEFAENTHRKAFTPSEAVAIGAALIDGERLKARQRQAATPDKLSKVPPCEKGRALDKVAEVVGMSRANLTKAKKVADAARAHPEEFGHLVEEMDRSGKVDPSYRKLVERQVRMQSVITAPKPLSSQPRNVVVGPWWLWAPADSKAVCEVVDRIRENLNATSGLVTIWFWSDARRLPSVLDTLGGLGLVYSGIVVSLSGSPATQPLFIVRSYSAPCDRKDSTLVIRHRHGLCELCIPAAAAEELFVIEDKLVQVGECPIHGHLVIPPKPVAYKSYRLVRTGDDFDVMAPA